MVKGNLLENVTDITLYTGTYGRKKCTCKCIGCTQESYGRKRKPHQGTIEQIREIIDRLPNLENAYFLGNPDVSVDTEFCNKAAKEFIKNGKKVMFSTSGFNAEEKIKVLLDGINPEFVDYISYSIDSIDEEKNHYLKGSNNISIERVGEAIKYCQSLGIRVKIQPTLWEVNQDDYIEIIEYFYNNYGIKWYTFHAGSFESLIDKEVDLKHIKPDKWRKIVKDIEKIAKEKDLKVLVPRIFLDEKEMIEYKKSAKNYCANGGRGLQIWMEEDFLRATYCPLLTEINDSYSFSLNSNTAQFIDNNAECAICNFCIDKELKKCSIKNDGRQFESKDGMLYNVCRFYSIRYQY